MITKTQIEIMKLFVARINGKFSINEIATTLKKPYALIHRSVKKLIEESFIFIDKRKLLSLNYKKHFAELNYIESIRLREKIENYKSISLFLADCLKEIKNEFFILLFFGSFVEKSKFNDIDTLVVVNKEGDIEKMEKIILNIASNFTFKLDLQVISKESAHEMLSKREQLNIFNESLDKHLIVFGGENYYRLITNARR
jgi:predicted transcriptional regulator